MVKIAKLDLFVSIIKNKLNRYFLALYRYNSHKTTVVKFLMPNKTRNYQKESSSIRFNVKKSNPFTNNDNKQFFAALKIQKFYKKRLFEKYLKYSLKLSNKPYNVLINPDQSRDNCCII